MGRWSASSAGPFFLARPTVAAALHDGGHTTRHTCWVSPTTLSRASVASRLGGTVGAAALQAYAGGDDHHCAEWAGGGGGERRNHRCGTRSRTRTEGRRWRRDGSVTPTATVCGA